MIYKRNQLITLLNKHKEELNLLYKYIKSIVLAKNFINELLNNKILKKEIFKLFNNIFQEVNYNDMYDTNIYYCVHISYLYFNYKYVDVDDLLLLKEELIDNYDEEENKIRFIILLIHIYKTYIDKYEVDLY